ncbi:ribosome biogenesis protein TSR1 [Histoplasma capsulatum G186AR]|uniref:Ribosome biogenesis protein TSR1 n=2 Tax=Ajellomyces capsulatus TaxID=5037 RepID=C0NCX6_AJECG|nr:ribosome biogenesis protein TSR1 [Histoplasma capsulatum G186AR]EEH11517.1 ribosome biogenesis protein TSR1 [Histoplasma capsulatum G186AR]KAG5302640.1 ribosome biogenesis protein TSR1 [Histoplasma capsulatum]QSS71959.1 ribosome biogenesis protein TSR1 [Histoplasma capsulatum G186AR]
MAPSAVAVPHHHRNTTKSINKAFKSKHMSKGALKDLSKGKIEERGSRKTPHQQLMSKLDRRNQARQKQRLKHKNQSESVSIFSGQNGASKHVAVIPLADTVNTEAAIRSLNESLDIPETDIQGRMYRVRIERFKQNVLYIPTRKDLISALDTCRLADFVIFILPADNKLDEGAKLMLRAIEGQGISNVLAVVQGLEKITPPKKRQQFTASLKSFIAHFFPTLDKVHSLDSRQECSNIVRGICTATPKGIRWRDDRSWMLIESVLWPEPSSEASGEVIVTGVVRGRGLKADRLVHIPTWGDYKITSITAAPSLSLKQREADGGMSINNTVEQQVLDQPSVDCDDMATVAPEEVVMMDDTISMADTEKKGVLLDDHHYFSDGDDKHSSRPRRLPKGTSDYQAAWYLDDVSDSGSDLVDEMDDIDDGMDLDTPAGPEDGFFNPDNRDTMTEAGPSEYPQSEMFLDPSPEDEAQQIEEYRASRKNETKDDLEFPDEIELHPSTVARERLARYRGLKSLKTSRWEVEEDRAHEPEDWNRLLQVVDYKGSKNQCLREALVGGVKAGTRVNVHLGDVPLHLKSLPSQPTSLFSLLRHEHKLAVVNINMSLNSTVEEPLKSKEELIIQCGPRRLVIKPIFSAAGNTPNNVHKFDRYLHPGRSAVATFIGPVSWGSIPVLVFKKTATAATDTEAMDPSTDNSGNTLPVISSSNELENWELIGSGTTIAPDHSRVVAKRVILTGHPYKIHKKVVTVRYMFFNAEDVNWFKALQLWTKRGRSGYIKESLGTHGYFKATFDAKINPQDAIGISLYKRVFPRKAVAWGQEAH